MVGVIRGKTVSGADILDLLSCPIPIHFHPAPLYYDCPTRRTHRIDVSKLTRADRDALALALERSTSKITGTCATDDELLEDTETGEMFLKSLLVEPVVIEDTEAETNERAA
jgi:hypothetical protein